MKKYFSLASALMLALSMGMTSCSNDLDEVVTEKQPEMHKLYLKATAPNSTETRAFIEGVDGKEDAFTITGWKNGDKLYGIYQNVTNYMTDDMKQGKPAIVEFEFKSSTNEFESEDVPATITNDKILYFIHGEGGLGGNMKLDYIYGWDVNFTFVPTSFAQTVDVENHFTGIMMSGVANVDGEGNLTTDMRLPNNLSFICLHNDSELAITAKLIEIVSTTVYYVSNSFMDMSGSRIYNVYRDVDSNKALTAEIPAHGKAYLPVQKTRNTFKVEVNGSMVASKTGTEAGKVYSLTYPSSKFVAK